MLDMIPELAHSTFRSENWQSQIMINDTLINTMVNRLMSRYELTYTERVAMANELQRLQIENKKLQERVTEMGWRLNPDRMGQ